jgi:hypothetical protein
MTRTFKTIAALAFVAIAAPAFAHGHGGMNSGPNSNSMNSMAWNKVDNRVERHHDGKLNTAERRERILRLEAKLRLLWQRLAMEKQGTFAFNRTSMEVHRVLAALGALVN